MNMELMRLVFPVEMARVERGLCAWCRCKLADVQWRDALSLREAGISGLCQGCQDKVFGTGEEPKEPGDCWDEDVEVAF